MYAQITSTQFQNLVNFLMEQKNSATFSHFRSLILNDNPDLGGKIVGQCLAFILRDFPTLLRLGISKTSIQDVDVKILLETLNNYRDVIPLEEDEPYYVGGVVSDGNINLMLRPLIEILTLGVVISPINSHVDDSDRHQASVNPPFLRLPKG
ncbi:MAG: hypothetical protein K0R12_1404 [Gammaproteobacteria bacterium]|jgi:hypothetical protein|nr:hypothetical protein [Gammaproteobacteria bacterium]